MLLNHKKVLERSDNCVFLYKFAEIDSEFGEKFIINHQKLCKICHYGIIIL